MVDSLEAWRRDAGAWLAFVRYSVGVGLQHLDWVEAGRVGPPDEGGNRPIRMREGASRGPPACAWLAQDDLDRPGHQAVPLVA